jgi:hypothetical protein
MEVLGLRESLGPIRLDLSRLATPPIHFAFDSVTHTCKKVKVFMFLFVLSLLF